MVELAKFGGAMPIVKAPDSAVSPGEVAAPYKQLGEALDKTGEALMEVAKPLAKQAGQEAVQKDADGNLVVNRTWPILGPAGAEFTRAAHMTALAKLQPEIEDKMTEMRLAHPNDPIGFRTAADEYAKTLKVPDPRLQAPVDEIISRNASQNYRSMIVAADTLNTQNAQIAYKSRLTAINEQGVSLARQGGTDTPEYKQLAEDRAQLYQELTKDPRFGYPKERADQELKDNRDADVVQAVIGDVTRTYMTKRNGAEAKTALQNAFWGPGSEKLNLSAQKRDAAVSEGMKTLASMDATDRADIAENRTATQAYLRGLQAAPGAFNPIVHNNYIENAKANGDIKSLMDLDAARAIVPLWQALQGSQEQQVSVLKQMQRGAMPVLSPKAGELPAYWTPDIGARANGVNPGLLAVMKRASEISGTQFIIGDKGGTRDQATQDDLVAKGASQTRNSNHLTGHALDLIPIVNGKPDANASPEEYAKLSAAMKQAAKEMGLPLNWGGDWKDFKDLAHFEIPREGGVAMAPGQPIGEMTGAQLRLFNSTVANLRESVGKNLDKMADNMVTTLVDKRQTLGPDEIASFADAVVATGRTDLVPKVQAALDAYEKFQGVQAVGGLSKSLTDQLKTVAASGVDPIKRETINTLVTMSQKEAEGMKKDPLQQGAINKWVAPIAPLDPANPQATANELVQREKNIRVVQQHAPSMEKLTVVGDQEGQQIKTALTQGDPTQASALLGSFAALSPEVYRDTMASDPMKEALSGMIRSRDPVRMTAGFGALDRMWRTDPWGFQATFGEGSLTHLQAWQGLKDSFSPAEIAERLNRADDPSVATARTRIAKEVDDELKNFKPGDVAYQMGTSFGIPLLSTVANPFTGATPPVPADSVSANAMLADYEGTYKALRIYGVDADQAKKLTVQRLTKEWAPSATAGGQLMKYPPEAFYKPINGSQKWLQEDLSKHLTEKLGPQVSVAAEGFPEAQPVFNWSLKSIISDAQTEAEIAGGKPPSYRVAVQDKFGLVNIMPDRVAWNSKPHVETYERTWGEIDKYRKDVQQIQAQPAMGPF